jgi:uncharacterized spore protein YtfJ
MDNTNFIEKLASLLGQNGSVKNVFGDPVLAGDKTIIPVARIAYGFGGGYGQGKKNKQIEGPDAEGAGGGGGLYARPYGIYEVTPTRTRFMPANTTREFLVAFAIGFFVRGWMNAKKKNKKNL